MWLVGKNNKTGSEFKKNITVRDRSTTTTLTGSVRGLSLFYFYSFFYFVVIQGVECNFLKWSFEHNETQEVKNIIAPHSL